MLLPTTVGHRALRDMRGVSGIEGKALLKATVIVGCMLAASSAFAERTEINLFGTPLTILGRDLEPWTLTVGGRKLLSNYVMSLSRVGVLGGVGYAVGKSGGGGNACDTPPFILSFPVGKPARLDGPVDACRSVEITYFDDRIVLKEAAIAGEKASEWTWTPADGLRRREIVQAANTAIDWDSVRERSISHPADLLKSATFSEALSALLGPTLARYRATSSGPGSVNYDGEILIATSCAPHRCDEEEQITVLDPQERKLFVARKQIGAKVVVFPEVKQWPSKARTSLAGWARRWK